MIEEKLSFRETITYITIEFKSFWIKDKYNNLYFLFMEAVLLYLYDHCSIILNIIKQII
jgi:hypothetical protein